MSIRVTSAASDRLLCALEDVKSRLSITDSSLDSRLTTLIRASSAAIESYLGRPLARQSYSEGVAGNNRRRLLLSRYPVDSDSVTLTIDDDAQTDFTVEVPEIGQLWRESDWSSTGETTGQDGEFNVVVAYKAGYVLPTWVSDFTISTAYSVGAWVRPGVPVKDLLFECTTAGTSHSSAPTWPTTGGTTVTSNTAVFTARHAVELPWDIQEAALLAAAAWYAGGLDVPATIESESLGPMSVRYREAASSLGSALPMATVALIEAYR